MVISGKVRAVAKSVFPPGIESQEQWESHARRKINEYRWRLSTIDKEEGSLNEYGHTPDHQELIDDDMQQEADYERRDYGYGS